MNTNAWVTLVMINDNYVPGAIVLAESLRINNTLYPIICMVSPSVTEKARQILQILYELVIEVPYISHEVKPLRGVKQKELYKLICDLFIELEHEKFIDCLKDKASMSCN